MFKRLTGDYTVEFWMVMHRIFWRGRDLGDAMKAMGVSGLMGLSRKEEEEALKQADAIMKSYEPVYNSMTKEERRKIHSLNGKRRQRIARGAGLNYSDASLILDQFDNMRFLKF
jgi:signal recognition particle subunit SRP54